QSVATSQRWRKPGFAGRILPETTMPYLSPRNLVLGILLAWSVAGPAPAESPAVPRVVDLSLLVAPELPCTWAAGFAPFHQNHYLRIGPLSAYNSDILAIDENTGTQFDAPAHSIPPPDTRFPNAGPAGLITGDRVPAWQFVGEACVL